MYTHWRVTYACQIQLNRLHFWVSYYFLLFFLFLYLNVFEPKVCFKNLHEQCIDWFRIRAEEEENEKQRHQREETLMYCTGICGCVCVCVFACEYFYQLNARSYITTRNPGLAHSHHRAQIHTDTCSTHRMGNGKRGFSELIKNGKLNLLRVNIGFQNKCRHACACACT